MGGGDGIGAIGQEGWVVWGEGLWRTGTGARGHSVLHSPGAF